MASPAFVPHHVVHAAEGSQPTRSLFLLHGIFGSSRNWRSFARSLAEAIPDWRVIAVDLRHHGESKAAPPPDTVDACALDLLALERALGQAPAAVIGHSFGGKVALAYARGAPGARGAPESLERVIVLDSPPGAGALSFETPSNTEVARVLAALRELPMPVAERAGVIAALTARGVAKNVAQWMATNLVLVSATDAPPRYDWTFDVAAMERLIHDYWQVDFYPWLEARAANRSPIVSFVQAERSDRFSAAETARLRALAARGAIDFEILPRAGHWLHVDNPRGLLELLSQRLR